VQRSLAGISPAISKPEPGAHVVHSPPFAALCECSDVRDVVRLMQAASASTMIPASSYCIQNTKMYRNGSHHYGNSILSNGFAASMAERLV
jgi:hypothetical protein